MGHDVPSAVVFGIIGGTAIIVVLALLCAYKKVFRVKNPELPEQMSQISNVGSDSVSTDMKHTDNTSGVIHAATVSTRYCRSSPTLECNETHNKMEDVPKKLENISEPQVETSPNPDTEAHCQLHTVEGEHKINVASNDGACSSNDGSKDKTASTERTCSTQKKIYDDQRPSCSSANQTQPKPYVRNAPYEFIFPKRSRLEDHAHARGERSWVRMQMQIGRRRLSNDSGYDECEQEGASNLDSSLRPGKMVSLNDVDGRDAECYVQTSSA